MNDIGGNMERFDRLKEKNVKDIVQFFRESGFHVPEDDWFELDVPELKEEKSYVKVRYLFATGANNRIYYNELEDFHSYKVDNQIKYNEHIKKRAKQRIKGL